tara:strand:- start:518 stop:1207 length:690 start_codon:yes stop_codon:yes gene_type:complete
MENINQLNESFQTVYFPNEVIINLILSFFLGLFISYVYKVTHKGMSYSQSFLITNIFISLIVCMVIMVIGNNLARAFALVGALSIIRFRTVVKDTKDIAFIFWSLAAGLSSGTGSYFIAISGSFIIALVAFILFKTNYGSIYKSEFILQFIFEKNSEQKEALYLDTFKQYCNSSTLLNSEMSGDNKKLKLTFDIMLKEEKQINDFIMEVSKLPGVSETSLVSTKNDIDY